MDGTIHRVVHDFEYQMVEAFAACASDIHPWTLPYRLQALQDCNLVSTIRWYGLNEVNVILQQHDIHLNVQTHISMVSHINRLTHGVHTILVPIQVRLFSERIHGERISPYTTHEQKNRFVHTRFSISYRMWKGTSVTI
jgi:hypothetical protein